MTSGPPFALVDIKAVAQGTAQHPAEWEYEGMPWACFPWCHLLPY